MKEVVAKHQQVPVADWFLTGEAGFEDHGGEFESLRFGCCLFFCLLGLQGHGSDGQCKE